MIIKIDHLALSVDNESFSQLIEIMISLGYKLNFLEKNLKNLDIKRTLMKKFSLKHDLALLTSKKNINIEIINHHRINKNQIKIFPLLDNFSVKFLDGQAQNGEINNMYNIKNIKYFYQSIRVGCSKNKQFAFNNLIIKTADLNNSVKFWNMFNFKTVISNKNSVELEFDSYFKDNNCRLILEKNKGISKKTFLDDNGFNCLAFISSSAAKERQRIIASGVKATKIERVIVNKKKLDIFFAMGDQGEVAEIIGLGS